MWGKKRLTKELTSENSSAEWGTYWLFSQQFYLTDLKLCHLWNIFRTYQPGFKQTEQNKSSNLKTRTHNRGNKMNWISDRNWKTEHELTTGIIWYWPYTSWSVILSVDLAAIFPTVTFCTTISCRVHRAKRVYRPCSNWFAPYNPGSALNNSKLILQQVLRQSDHSTLLAIIYNLAYRDSLFIW